MTNTLKSLAVSMVLSAVAFAQGDVFHGWSKDGTYLVYETVGHNDVVELFFCHADPGVTPTWPKELNELDKMEGMLICVRFLDQNKAPYQWKNLLALPAPSMKSGGVVVNPELETDGETPGFVLESQGKKQSCYVSGLHEGSKLQKTWLHPSGKFAAALIDGRFSHCVVTLKGADEKKPKKKK